MTNLLQTSILCAALTLGGMTAASATTILEKGLDTSDFGWNSNVNGNLQQSTDDVQLDSAATVTSISWYGFGNGTDTANFTDFVIRVFDNIVESAVTTFFYEDFVTATAEDTGMDQAGNDIFFYTADIATLNLAGGTLYELMIASTDADLWTWNFSAPEEGDQFHRNGDDDEWREIAFLGNGSHAFSLHGDVAPIPLPAGMPLLLAGLGAFALTKRRREA